MHWSISWKPILLLFLLCWSLSPLSLKSNLLNNNAPKHMYQTLGTWCPIKASKSYHLYNYTTLRSHSSTSSTCARQFDGMTLKSPTLFKTQCDKEKIKKPLEFGAPSSPHSQKCTMSPAANLRKFLCMYYWW